jgi:hypothetical protein
VNIACSASLGTSDSWDTVRAMIDFVMAGVNDANKSAATSVAAPILFRVFKFINLRMGWGLFFWEMLLMHADEQA